MFPEGRSLLDKYTESREFERLAGKGIRSIGTAHKQLGFWKKELVEDLFNEGKRLLDRSMESCEFDSWLGRV